MFALRCDVWGVTRNTAILFIMMLVIIIIKILTFSLFRFILNFLFYLLLLDVRIYFCNNSTKINFQSRFISVSMAFIKIVVGVALFWLFIAFDFLVTTKRLELIKLIWPFCRSVTMTTRTIVLYYELGIFLLIHTLDMIFLQNICSFYLLSFVYNNFFILITEYSCWG